ncbi:MAG: D-alanine--D-alanine ligase [Patescibacteria group bacterium]|nr:D-alanine--D-alanine ligase [Patescibacteria group bacterium]
MAKKIKVGILFGGRSAEHEVSLQSAKNIVDAIDKDKYEVLLIGIDKSGKWFLLEQSQFLINEEDPKLIRLNTKKGKDVAITPQSNGFIDKEVGDKVDVVFPILHGPFGEDGTVQGLLKLANIPFVGADVLGSAIGMDKDVMKRLLKEAGIPTANFLVFKKEDSIDFNEVVKKLNLPVFVKPANLGSSIGISKARNRSDFNKAVKKAFSYNLKIIIEESIIGREIECSVLGNEDPTASVLGEVIPNDDFYSYDAKYIDEDGAKFIVPADISKEKTEEIQRLAIKTFKTLECKGLGRIDFFLKEDGNIFVIEINTIPGFTKISMYPHLWEESGISYTELIDQLVQLALKRFNQR